MPAATISAKRNKLLLSWVWRVQYIYYVLFQIQHNFAAYTFLCLLKEIDLIRQNAVDDASQQVKVLLVLLRITHVTTRDSSLVKHDVGVDASQPFTASHFWYGGTS